LDRFRSHPSERALLIVRALAGDLRLGAGQGGSVNALLDVVRTRAGQVETAR
jgi:hypothetical protein